MRRISLPIAVARWLRRYAVLTALLSILGADLIPVALHGMGPRPQLPPDGYATEQGTVTLQWNRGTIDKPIVLQVSATPDFSDIIEEQTVTGTTHRYNRRVERGQTYYWRLLQDDVPSPVSRFIVPETHVHL